MFTTSLFSMLHFSAVYYSGCYSAAPLSTTKGVAPSFINDTGQPTVDCRRACDKVYRYAIVLNSDCLCLHSLQNGVQVSDATCDVTCDDVTCGGSGGHYSAYRTTANRPFPTILPVTSFSVAIEGIYSPFNTSFPVVDFNETFLVVPKPVGGTYVMYKISYGDGSPVVYSENVNWTYSYTNAGIYLLEITAMNEHSEIVYSSPIKVTFPLDPIVDMTVNTSVVEPTNTVFGYSLALSSGNDLTCNFSLTSDLGHSEVLPYYSKDFMNLHTIPQSLSVPGLYTVHVYCMNFISTGEATTSVMIQEPVSGLSTAPFIVFDSSHLDSFLSWVLVQGSHVFYRAIFDGSDVNGVFTDASNTSIPQGLYLTRGYFDFIVFAWNNISGPVNATGQVYVEQGVRDFNMEINTTTIKSGTCINITLSITDGTKADHVLQVDGSEIFNLHFVNEIGFYQNSTILCFNTPGVKRIYTRVNNTIRTLTQTGEVKVFNAILGIECSFSNVSQWQDQDSTILRQATGFNPPTNTTFNITYGDGLYHTITDVDISDTQPLVINHTYVRDAGYDITVTLVNDVSTFTCSDSIRVGFPIDNPVIQIAKNLYHTGEVLSLSASIQRGSNVNVTCDFSNGFTDSTLGLPPGVPWVFNHSYSVNDTYAITCTLSNDYGLFGWSDSVLIQELIADLSYTGALLYETDLPFTQWWTLTSGSHLTYLCTVDGVNQPNVTQYDSGGNVRFSGLPLGVYYIDLVAYNNVSGSVNISDYIHVERRVTGLAVTADVTLGEANVTYYFNVSMLSGSNIDVVVSIEGVGDEVYTLLGDYPQGHSRQFPVSFTQSGGYTITATATNRHGNTSTYLIFGIDNPILGFSLSAQPGLDYTTPVSVQVQQDPLAPPPTTLFSLDVWYGDGTIGSWTGLTIDSNTPFTVPHSYTSDGDYSLGAKLSNQYNLVWLNTSTRVGQPIEGVSWSLDKYIFATLENVVFNFYSENGTNIAASIEYSDGIALNRPLTRQVWETFSRTFSSAGNFTMNLTLANVFPTVSIQVPDDVQIQVPINDYFMRDYYLFSIYSSIDIDWRVLTGSHLNCNVTGNGVTLVPSTCGPTVTFNVSSPGNQIMPVGLYPVTMLVWNVVSGPYALSTMVQVERELAGLGLTVSNRTPLPRQLVDITLTLAKGSNMNISVGTEGEEVVSDWAGGDLASFTRTYQLSYPVAGWFSINVTVTNPLQMGELVLWTSVSVENPVINVSMKADNTVSFSTPTPLTFTLTPGTLPPSNGTLEVFLDGVRMAQGVPVSLTELSPFRYNLRTPADGKYNVTAILSNDVSSQTFHASIVVGALPSGVRMWSDNNEILTRDTFLIKATFTNGSDLWVTVDFGDGRQSQAFLMAGAVATLANMYSAQGDYHVTYTMETSVGPVYGEYPTVVYVEDPVEITDLTYSGLLMVDERVRYEVRVRTVGRQYCFSWDFSTGVDGLFILGPPDCQDTATARGATYIQWEYEDGPQSLMYAYSSVGKFSLTVMGWNRLSNHTKVLSLRFLPCPEPSFYIGGFGANNRQAATYRKSETVVLRVHGKSKCTEYTRLNLVCIVYKVENDTETLVANFTDQWVLKFSRRYFEYGTYKVWCETTERFFPLVTTTAVKFFDIVKSPLVLRIKGGRQRLVGVLSKLKLDIRGSAYDPDTDETTNVGLRFSWFIQLTNGNLHNILDEPLDGMTVDMGSARRKRDTLSQSHDVIQESSNNLTPLVLNRVRRAAPITSGSVTTVYIPGDTLNTTVYHFLAVATHGDRSATAYQTVLVTPGYTPSIGIKLVYHNLSTIIMHSID